MNDISSPTLRARRIVTGADYIQSLRGRGLNVWLFGEKVEEPVDHPVIRPSINALARTYELAVEHPSDREARHGRAVGLPLAVVEAPADPELAALADVSGDGLGQAPKVTTSMKTAGCSLPSRGGTFTARRTPHTGVPPGV